MEKLFIVGAGVMGRGIAQVAAENAIPVLMSDSSLEFAQKGVKSISDGLEKLVAKGKITQDRAIEILSCIEPVGDLTRCQEASFIIESASEKVAVKQKIFAELEQKAAPDTILATNTTSCSITEIASAVSSPERVVGFHFFNPAPLMKLVEIMPGLLTAKETLQAASDFALLLGKEPVVTDKEGPAGVSSRILAGLLNEAVWVLFEGIAGVQEIDRSVMLGCGHKIGPLSLIDLIGVDIHYAKTKMLYDKTGDARYRPCYLLEQMLNAGLLGRKSGRGFYDYTQSPPIPTRFAR